MLFAGEPHTALTSDPAYPTILFPELFGLVSYGYVLGTGKIPEIFFPMLFGPGRACELSYSLGNRILHSPVTLHTRRYCLSHSGL